MHLIPPASKYDSMCEMSTRETHLRRSAWHRPKFQTPRRKTVIQQNHDVCTHRLGIVSHFQQLGTSGAPSWNPNTQMTIPVPSGEQAFLKVGSLKPARLTLLCTGGNGNLC